MRRTIGILAAVTALTAACTNDDGAPITHPVETLPEPTTVGAAPLPTNPVDPAEVRPDVLAAITLFPDELPDRYADLPLDTLETGFKPAGGDLANALDPADEADDIIRYGQLGEFTINYGISGEDGLAIAATQFATSTGATGYLDDWVLDLSRGAIEPSADRHQLEEFSAEPRGGLGEAAVRATFVSVYQIGGGREERRDGAALAIRQAELIAWVWGFGDNAAATVDDLGPVVARRLSEVADGSRPPRDPAVLGLSDPPTLALESFAFEYAYGVDAADVGFTVTIDGVFEGPDRTSCRTRITGSGPEATETYVVAVGTRVWVGDLAGYDETPLRDPAALTALAGCPGHPHFWEVTRFHRLPMAGAEEITVSGIPAIRADLTNDPAAMAAAGVLGAETGEFDRYEITVARDGGWPLRIEIERTLDVATALALFGIPSGDVDASSAPARVFDSLAITRVDDPTVAVKAPLPAG